MRIAATDVHAYLDGLPEDRRTALTAVREIILANLPEGYVEAFQYGMIGYCVPHSLYPKGYHCDASQPLPFAALASQKNYMALYLCTVYEDPEMDAWFRSQFLLAGKRLDMGKSCIRFKKLDDLPVEVIGQAVARVPVATYIERYEAVLAAKRNAPKPPKSAR